MARGGYSNPMQGHHKKARQKEMQRNKEKRTKERDKIALETKTVKEVKDEIQKLERDMKRHHGQQQKSNAEHKLARLKKELTLLQEAAAAAKAKAIADGEAYKIANKYRQPQRPLTELDDPRKSVYYDPVMNPYGAPPPGKPRLYYRRFGGVTPNPNEAVVPGEDEPPPPPPPPPPRDGRHSRPPHHRNSRGAPDHRHQSNNSNNHHQQQNRQPQNQQQEGSSSRSQDPPKRQPLHVPPPNKPQSITKEAKNNKDSSNTIARETLVPTEEKKPTLDLPDKPMTDAVPQKSIGKGTESSMTPVIPSLPAPSEAVQRTMRVARNKQKTKRGKTLADIWASTEEVEYERVTNLVDLEADDLGIAKAKTKTKKKKKKKKKPPLEFYYRDNSGNVQGPYSKAQIKGWMDAGFFPLTTKARTNRMDPDGWVPMGDLPALKDVPTKNVSNSVQDRIASLKGGGNKGNEDGDDDGMDASMQARIAAMKADLMASSATSKSPIEDDSAQGRIAAMRGNPDSGENNDDDGIDPSMQTRIAAMRADLMASSVTPENPIQEDSVQGRIAAMRGNFDSGENNDEYDIDPSMQTRIAAMRADLMASSTPPENAGEEDSVQGRIAALRGNSNSDKSIDDNGIDPSMQARIAAMRADLLTSTAPSNVTNNETNSNSIQDRIAALRDNSINNETHHDDGIDASIQARIEAMRADIAGPPPVAIDQTQEAEPSSGTLNVDLSLQDRIAALRKNAPPPPAATAQQYQEQNSEQESGEISIQDRIAALRKSAPPPPPPPVAYPVETDNHHSIEAATLAYPMGDAGDDGVAVYPIDNEDSSGVAAYPTLYPDEQDGVTTYPLDEATDEDAAFAQYPIDQAYPGAEDLAYPVTDSYPVENEDDEPPPYTVSDFAHPSEGAESPLVAASNRKVVQIDKALVSFVPSNLLSKKRKAEEGGTSVEDDKRLKKMKALTNVVTTSDDNYDKFLQEIDGL